MAPASQPRRSSGRLRRAAASVAAASGRVDRHPKLVLAAKLMRELLPGDSRFGDPLSTTGSKQSQLLGRRVAELTSTRPGVLREAGLSALQVWQALAEAQGRGQGNTELTIVFTDLVDFSTWALEAGDDAAVELLRDVGQAIEPPVKEHGGEVVKRLGDGMLAIFDDPHQALEAIFAGRDRLAQVAAPSYEPHMRTGMHVGRPRKLGADYIGVDVNIAARIAEQAVGDELLISDQTLALLDGDAITAHKKHSFAVKGVPEQLATYSIASNGGPLSGPGNLPAR